MNTLYIWLICWAVGLTTYVLLGFRKIPKKLNQYEIKDFSNSGSIMVTVFLDKIPAEELEIERKFI